MLTELPESPRRSPPRKRLPRQSSKYGNHRVTHDGMTFDSKAELRRWQELKLREKAGEIANLRRQVSFPLVVDGKPVRIRSKGYPKGRACRYRADFVFDENGITKVQDLKGGVDDAAARLRRGVVEAIYGIQIEVVR